MEHINKPKQLREALGLDTPALAGKYILEIEGRHKASSMWWRIEDDNKARDHMSNHLSLVINRLLWMIEMGNISMVKRMLRIPKPQRGVGTVVTGDYLLRSLGNAIDDERQVITNQQQPE